VSYGLRAVLTWPFGATYVLAMPVRFAQRRLFGDRSEPVV
jgi:hypothetical protein